jgi:hypothetical protein
LAIDIVILAGAPADPEMQPEGPPISRAMVPVAGKTMIQWLSDACRGASSVGRVVAIGDVEADGIDTVLSPRDTFLQNVMLAVESASTDRFLLCCCDIPMITPEAIDDFVIRALEADVDFCFPIVPQEDCMAKYPELKRTYAKTQQGTFTGGNAVLVDREFMRRNEKIIGDVYAERKNVLKLASIIGLPTLVRVLLAQIAFPGMLPIPVLEASVSKLLGGRVKAIVSHYPEIGEDVDKPSDLEIVCKVLSSR